MTKKIILGVLLIVIGLPLALILTASACFYIMDKTNRTIVSSDVTRRYLLYVPKAYDRSKATPLVISLHPGAPDNRPRYTHPVAGSAAKS